MHSELKLSAYSSLKSRGHEKLSARRVIILKNFAQVFSIFCSFNALTTKSNFSEVITLQTFRLIQVSVIIRRVLIQLAFIYFGHILCTFLYQLSLFPLSADCNFSSRFDNLLAY